jgi:hypothetical protein
MRTASLCAIVDLRLFISFPEMMFNKLPRLAAAAWQSAAQSMQIPPVWCVPAELPASGRGVQIALHLHWQHRRSTRDLFKHVTNTT